MTFTTMALIGLGLAGGAAAAARARKKKTEEPQVSTLGGRRRAPADAVYTGQKAVRRSELGAVQAAADAGLSAAETTSANVASAAGVRERARKRAAAGGLILTAAQKGQPAPGGQATPLTLLGS